MFFGDATYASAYASAAFDQYANNSAHRDDRAGNSNAHANCNAGHNADLDAHYHSGIVPPRQ